MEILIMLAVVVFVFRSIIRIKVSSLERKIMVSCTEDDIATAKEAIRLAEEIESLPQDKERDIFKVHDMITKAVAKPSASQS